VEIFYHKNRVLIYESYFTKERSIGKTWIKAKMIPIMVRAVVILISLSFCFPSSKVVILNLLISPTKSMFIFANIAVTEICCCWPTRPD